MIMLPLFFFQEEEEEEDDMNESDDDDDNDGEVFLIISIYGKSTVSFKFSCIFMCSPI